MNQQYRPVRDIQAAPDSAPQIRQIGKPGIKTVLAVLAALSLVLSGVGYATVGKLGNDVASAGNLALGGGGGVRDARDGATDILLVGSDSRTDAQGNPLSREELDKLRAGEESGAENTDTIMVIRVPNDGSSATAVSIPRDTYIHDEQFGNMKINGVYGAYKGQRHEELLAQGNDDDHATEEASIEAGRQGLVKAVSNLTGVEVDHYAEIGLLGFVLLTDAVGGVDVCLNNDVDDEFSGANFPAGQQTLDGVQALAFVRQRHGLPRGDLDRVTRQHAFMASMVNKVLSAGTLTNPTRLSEMSGAVQRSVVIDSGWDIMSFATQLSDLAGGNVTFSTIPVTSINGTGDYGESIVTIDPDEVHAFMDELLGNNSAEDTPEVPEETDELNQLDIHKSVNVLNAGTTAGLAGSVAEQLRQDNISVGEVANAMDGVYTESQIVAASADDPEAEALSHALGGIPVTVNENLDSDTLIVVTADDYSGPHGELDEQAEQEETGESDEASDTVGQPGADFGEAEVSPEIDAGGDAPRCVN